MNETPDVSVVMVSYRTGPLLFRALDSVLQQAATSELLLVNNGNPPPIEVDLRRLSAQTKNLVLIEGQGNVGFARACNLGARRAKEPLLLFLNPDCLLPDQGLRVLLQQTQRLSRPWLMGCRLLDSAGREQAGARRHQPSVGALVAEGLGLSRLFPRWLPRVNLHRDPLPEQITEVEVTSGACMMIPAEDYWAVGGMDEGYFLHVEDIDFCVRFRAFGGRVYFSPQVAAVHHKSTSEVDPLLVEWHKTRGFFRYFRKHRTSWSGWLGVLLADSLVLVRFVSRALLRGAGARRYKASGAPGESGGTNASDADAP